MKMLEHTVSQMKTKVDALNPIMIITLETKIDELKRELHDLRNLYSSPQSSLNKVLDGILTKVKELDKHVFAKPSLYGE